MELSLNIGDCMADADDRGIEWMHKSNTLCHFVFPLHLSSFVFLVSPTSSRTVVWGKNTSMLMMMMKKFIITSSPVPLHVVISSSQTASYCIHLLLYRPFPTRGVDVPRVDPFDTRKIDDEIVFFPHGSNDAGHLLCCWHNHRDR